MGAGSNAAWQHKRNDTRHEPTSNGCCSRRGAIELKEVSEKESISWYAAVNNDLQSYAV